MELDKMKKKIKIKYSRGKKRSYRTKAISHEIVEIKMVVLLYYVKNVTLSVLEGLTTVKIVKFVSPV